MTIYTIFLLGGIVTHGKVPTKDIVRVYYDAQKACEFANGERIFRQHYPEGKTYMNFDVVKCVKKDVFVFEPWTPPIQTTDAWKSIFGEAEK